MSIEVATRLITVKEYHKMAEAGILTDDDRVQLIDGIIYTMSPVTSLHAAHVKRINRLLSKTLGDQACIGVQDPIQIGETSEPEPDISVLHFREDYYIEKHPVPSQIFFLIEVSSSTVHFDKKIKSRLYASADIPEYWIINLEEEQIEVYQNPNGNRYMYEKIYRRGDDIYLKNFDMEIKAEQILG